MMHKKNSISIYTDGSCHTQYKIGGWAAILLLADNEITLQGFELETTHNQMELLAVIKALSYVKDQDLTYEKIKIFSDSQYVVGIKERKDKFIRSNFLKKSGNPIQNVSLVKELTDYIELMSLEFIKVKAHQKKTNIRNVNREVDKLSRKAVRDQVKRKGF